MPPRSATRSCDAQRTLPEFELSNPGIGWIYRDVIDPRYRESVQNIAPDELACWLLLKGELRLNDDTRRLTIRPGDVVLLSDADFAASWHAASTLVSIRLRLPADRGLALWNARGVLHLRKGSSSAFARATRALGDWSARHCPGTRTALRSCALTASAWLQLHHLYAGWLASLHAVMADHGLLREAPRHIDPRVLRAIELIRENPSLPERALALSVGLSLSRLQRLFRDQLESSIHRVADEARFRLARALLADPNARVKEIAARAGFASAQTFARWFRQRTGCPPTAYHARSLRLV